MADTIISIVSAVAGYFVTPIGRQLGYLFNYHSNVKDLKTQVEKVGGVRGRIERSVNAARRNGEEIEPDVEKWLESVNGITEEADEILLEDEDKAKKRCLNGLCPNLKSRYQLSKKAKKTAEKVVVEIQDGEKFGTVSYHPAPQGTIVSAPIKGYEKLAEEVVKIQVGGKFDRVSNCPAPQGTIRSAPIKDYEDFESRMSTLKEIMEALRNPNINMIGVYGMGGVGKTMLVEEVARKAKEDKLFDETVRTVVSQSPNKRKIQEEIAYPLGLRFNTQDIDCERVDRLCRRLKQEKSILIILDDVWARLDLEDIGIPSGDIHKGCKIVVTSRRLDLLSNQMNTQNNFGIEQLREEEAWNLFKKMAGDSVEAPEIKPTALKVAKECAGLPIAIVVVARALKNKRLHFWKDALFQLKKSALTSIEEMNAKVYLSLKLSYDFLESEAQKLMFLLCSLLPEDYQFSIQDLLYYGKGVGLFQDIEELEIARDSVRTLVDHLKASCLLMDGDTSGLFRMHDVVRDVAVSIASQDKHMLIVRNSAELDKWRMAEEQLKSRCAVSLPYIDIHELPPGFESPALEFFLFYSNNGSSKIPDSFFGGMKQLKVLTLRNMHFSSLPSSLLFLSSLQTLCLDQCTLPDISIIGELKKLEILAIRESNIEELPRGIGQLTRLKLLDLKDCKKLEVIRPNVIASLSQLEELYMENSFDRWEGDGNASLAELNKLSSLLTLEIYIPDPNILPNDSVFEKLTRYRLYIGNFQYLSQDYEFSRTLILAVNTSIHLLPGINKLLKRTENLHLEELNGFKSIINDLDGEGFPDLKSLHVENSSEIEYVINTMSSTRAFPNLESLSLKELINLKEICHGQLTAESFSNLRKVKVEYCNRLQNLFSLSVARRLSKLQEIKIIACEYMDGIVVEGREAAEDNNGAVYKIMFPQLRSLTLRALPKLVSFCSKVKAVPSTSDAGSKEIISISEDEHGIFIPFFNEKDTFPNLEKLDITSISMKEIWHSQLPEGSFCKLKHLKVEDCFDLSKIFPSNMLRRLQNMESMSVRSCGDYLEYIFDVGGINHTKRRHVVRTSCELRDLNLSELPGLINIWKNDSPGVFLLEKLRSLEVRWCPSLKNIFTSFRAKSLVQLQEVRIWDCDEMEEIVGKEGVDEEEATSKIVFSQVTSLNLHHLPQLKSFCQGIRMSEWPFLKTLKVSLCNNVEILASELRCFEETCGKVLFLVDKVSSCDNVEILASKLRCFKETCGKVIFLVDKVAFPKLEELDLDNLPKLTTVWKKDSQRLFQDTVEEIVGKEGVEEVFPQLTSLTFKKLPQLKNGIHISDWPSLKKLEVCFCDNVEILASDFSSFEKTCEKGHLGTPTNPPLFLVDKHSLLKVAFPNMEKLDLQGLPRLMAVWMMDSQGSLNFQKLSSLYICNCDSLINVFTTSMAQFQDMVEEIIEKEDEEAAAVTDKIMFPQVKSLTLECLKQLKSFCEWIHISEWPSLEDLKMSECHNVEIFASELSTFKETRGKANLGTPTEQPFFLVDKVAFPNLVQMELNHMSSMEVIWQGQFHAHSLCKLRVLRVKKCNKILKVFPISLLRNLQNLKVLSVEDCCSLEDVFELEGGVGETKHAFTFPPLKELRLIGLPKLMHLWKEDFPLSAVFQNLTTLEVSSCESLTHVFISTRAEGSMQIESTTDVSDKGESTDETTFSQLYRLKLKDLPNLTSFCQGSNNFFLPSLEKVFVEECPKLKTFSTNTFRTPKLENVQVNEGWLWDDDLNTTIKHMFEQKAEVGAEDAEED